MLLGALKERILSAKLEALRPLNREQILLYTDIGRMIVDHLLLQESYQARRFYPKMVRRPAESFWLAVAER
jgi:hypothetical protein